MVRKDRQEFGLGQVLQPGFKTKMTSLKYWIDHAEIQIDPG
jgi:hypothetical protein